MNILRFRSLFNSSSVNDVRVKPLYSGASISTVIEQDVSVSGPEKDGSSKFSLMHERARSNMGMSA